jgi:hypothetical protein
VELLGLKLKPIKWDVDDEALGMLWVVESLVTLPACLLETVKLVATKKADGSKEYTTVYDDGPYRPVELKYKRADLLALGKFDVARTREILGLDIDLAINSLLCRRGSGRKSRMEIGPIDYGIVR